MSRLLAAVLGALLLAMPIAQAGSGLFGGPHLGWPHHGPMDFALHSDPLRFGGDGRRLPDALIHGPRGPESYPHVDRRAHRPSGGTTRRFTRPMWAGGRLDWCADQRAGCGPFAAQLFCRRQGYVRVVEAVQERDVGVYAQTAQMASGLACAGPGCHGFLRITCTRG